jgi:hypothetical protein
MKKLRPALFLIAFVLLAHFARSQDCSQYLLLQQNKTIEMSIYNKKGDPDGRKVYSVSNVSSAGGTTTGTVNAQLFDKKDKSMASSTCTMKCTGGVFMADLRLSLPPQQAGRAVSATITGDGFVEYPSGMKAGDTLKRATMILSSSSGPGAAPPSGPPGPPAPPNPFAPGNITVAIFDRTVLGRDTVTTAAGHWNCVKISFKSKVSFKVGPFPTNINIDGIEWYAPGVGIIKSQTEHGFTAITSIK